MLVDRGLPPADGPRRIDVWWRGMKNGGLMAMLAHLLTQNWEWEDAEVRILRLMEAEAGREPARAALAGLIRDARIDAQATVVVSRDPFPDVLRRESRDATIVFLGFDPPTGEGGADFFRRYEALLVDMPTTLLVCSSGEADPFA